MKLGSLPRGLAVAALAAVTVVPFAATAASAAPAAPTAYTVFGSAQPLVWGSSSSVPVGNLHVPFVWGKTSNLAIAKSDVKLADPDENAKPLAGETIQGLTCTGYDEKLCKDPFTPIALAKHEGIDARHAEQAASFGGKDGKYPGRLQALTDCAGKCGEQFVRSLGNASGPAGALPGYVSIGSSSAAHDLSIDDKGRLVSTATSELTNVSIGPKNEVHFSKMVTSAQGFGSGAANTKDGRADLRISDFFILDNQVELTRAGLRLANAGPSEQEAYDGAKALLKQLQDRGIRLELPNFDAQLSKTPDHVAVSVRGLSVWFEQSVGSVSANALSYPLDLGMATAVVAALDINRHIEVTESPNGNVVVQTTAPAPQGPAPARGSGETAGGSQPAPTKNTGGTVRPSAPTGGNKSPLPTGTAPPSVPAPSAGEPAPPTSVDTGTPSEVVDPVPPLSNPDETAISLKDVERKLGLRGAHSVSRAFGAFLGLGLILPLARFVIRRLG
jgi:hypothetical protein